MKVINCLGEEMLYRNNSTGKPTRIHFTKEDGSTFCGWGDPFAEHVIADKADTITEDQCCKKCLKALNRNPHDPLS